MYPGDLGQSGAPGDAVMFVAPEKIRSGLVELRTKSGLVYVTPSFSERLYLLWTFRNFHRLPVEVLNRHQRQMIERLGQTAVVATQGRVPQSSLIGSVENIEIAKLSEANAAADTGKVVSMSAPVTFMGKAAGSEAVATGPRRLKLARPLIRFPGKSRSPKNISAPGPELKAQAQPRKLGARRFPQILIYQGSAKPLGIGLLVACCFALLLLYRREQRSAPPRSVPQAAIEARNPTPVSGVGTYIAEPEKSQLSTAAPSEAKTIAVDSASSKPAAETHPPAELANAVVSTAPLINPPQAETHHRPHISEWPGAFSYPIAPSQNLTGTVLLKAVIGINGAVTSVDILSGNRSLASAAAEAVKQWRYSPQKVNGVPTEAETNIAIDFRGDDAVSVSFPAR